MAHFSKLYILIRQAEIPNNSPQLQRRREPPLSLEPVYSIFLICKHLLSIPAYPWWVPRPLPIIPAFSHCCASILFHLQHTHTPLPFRHVRLPSVQKFRVSSCGLNQVVWTGPSVNLALLTPDIAISGISPLSFSILPSSVLFPRLSTYFSYEIWLIRDWEINHCIETIIRRR